jgi:hypothetical protein
MTTNYVLSGHEVVPETNREKWQKWFDEGDKQTVRKTEKNGVVVLTQFHGIGFCAKLPPLLFTTMVFGGEWNSEIEYYSTWDEAEQGHKEMCKKVFPPKP